MTESAVCPPHYKAAGMEAIDVIEAYGLDRDLYLGSAVQYLLRSGKKGDESGDLYKAENYIHRRRTGRWIGEHAKPQPLGTLSDYALCYLATPYSKYTLGIDKAFRDAAHLASRLLRIGVKVYSPISHTHPIAIQGGLDPLDHKIWLPFEERMMVVADALIVAHLQGWDESFGIAHEIKFFTDAGKPVIHIDPATLGVIS